MISAEAMAVIIGVICGVAVGIPTALLVMVIISEHSRKKGERGR